MTRPDGSSSSPSASSSFSCSQRRPLPSAAGGGCACAAARRERRADRRGRDRAGGLRSQGRVFRADGGDGAGAAAPEARVLPHQPGGRRHVSLVGDDHPDLHAGRPLPLATKYDVRIDAGATAVSGRKLAAPYTFSFMTATARLLQTDWYRPGGRFDAAPIIVMRFNQPVKPDDVAAHVRASFQPHAFTAPRVSEAAPGAPARGRSGRCRRSRRRWRPPARPRAPRHR